MWVGGGVGGGELSHSEADSIFIEYLNEPKIYLIVLKLNALNYT